jgi:hypothetical protein
MPADTLMVTGHDPSAGVQGEGGGSGDGSRMTLIIGIIWTTTFGTLPSSASFSASSTSSGLPKLTKRASCTVWAGLEAGTAMVMTKSTPPPLAS